MGRPVVHFEIIGSDPAGLRGYYGRLFGWRFQVGDAATATVSRPGEYGFAGPETAGIAGGVGGGDGFAPRVLFYVGVDDVEAALAEAERLGGRRLMGPEPQSGGRLSVGHFADPEGNVIGVAGPPREGTR
ncbi:VOC family protein [Actinomadura geliboluensis]|uniref:VOC family protein n=1 Tax=Actinomadura geliboluensis TaxID=882440 RepID=UPI003698228E